MRSLDIIFDHFNDKYKLPFLPNLELIELNHGNFAEFYKSFWSPFVRQRFQQSLLQLSR